MYVYKEKYPTSKVSEAHKMLYPKFLYCTILRVGYFCLHPLFLPMGFHLLVILQFTK